MTTRIRFQVFLDPPQLTALRDIEADTGAPIAAQVRRAVDAWLQARGEPLRRGPAAAAEPKRRSAPTGAAAPKATTKKKGK